MSVTFAKAPLVELIAELRWIPQGSSAIEPPISQQTPAATIFMGGTRQEEFYMRIGGALHGMDFNRSERLVPVGMPFVLHQPVYRFRSGADDKASVIFQVGYGLFSVHAIPPYHSWSRFLPFVKQGIEVLLQARPEADLTQPFMQANLRYIDFFGEQLTQGRDIQSFISDTLGVVTQLPLAITKAAASKEVKSLLTKVVLPIKIGDLTVSVGDGQFEGRPGILLDTTATSSQIASKLDVILDTYDLAYNVVHDLFIELTRPLHELMQPQGVVTK